MDAEVILQRFGNTSEQDKDSELEKVGDRATWSDLKKILSAAGKR